MKSLLLSLLLGFTLSLAYPGVASPPRGNLHFRFDLHDPTYIHVTLELTTSPTGADLLLLPSQWAGETELYRAVSNLHVTTPDATLSATGSPARCVLHSRHPKRVTVDYDLSQDWSGPLKHPFEHRAILGPNLFEFNGENGLVTPSISGTEPVDVTFDFADLPPTQTLITSFGTSVHQHVVGPWSDVRNALFTGGILKTEDLTVDGRRVLLAMYGTWAFTPAQIAPAIQHILKTERRLWHDTAIPFYAIVISPYDSTASGGGGSGFTNIFNLFLADRQTFSIDTASLIAHEAFHHWNPRALASSKTPRRSPGSAKASPASIRTPSSSAPASSLKPSTSLASTQPFGTTSSPPTATSQMPNSRTPPPPLTHLVTPPPGIHRLPDPSPPPLPQQAPPRHRAMAQLHPLPSPTSQSPALPLT